MKIKYIIIYTHMKIIYKINLTFMPFRYVSHGLSCKGELAFQECSHVPVLLTVK